MRINQILKIISEHFEISKETLYQSILHDNYFRVFVKSKQNVNIDAESLCKEILESNHLFMTNFYSSKIN